MTVANTFRFLNRDRSSLRLRINAGRKSAEYRFTPGVGGWDVVSYDELGPPVRYWIDALEDLDPEAWHCSCPGMTRRGQPRQCKHVRALRAALARLALDDLARKAGEAAALAKS